MKAQKIQKFRNVLKKSCIGIAGLGGLGSNAAVSLARVGVGRLVLVDFDRVEKSNLNRQYFFLDQVGMYKTEALKKNIERINPDIETIIHNIRLVKGLMDSPFRDVDIVIEALDDASTKTDFIEEILIKLPDTPLVAASGVAGYGNSDRIHTMRSGNLYLCYDEQSLSSDEDVLTAPRVGLMANWEANLAVEILLRCEQ